MAFARTTLGMNEVCVCVCGLFRFVKRRGWEGGLIAVGKVHDNDSMRVCDYAESTQTNIVCVSSSHIRQEEALRDYDSGRWSLVAFWKDIDR